MLHVVSYYLSYSLSVHAHTSSNNCHNNYHQNYFCFCFIMMFCIFIACFQYVLCVCLTLLLSQHVLSYKKVWYKLVVLWFLYMLGQSFFYLFLMFLLLGGIAKWAFFSKTKKKRSFNPLNQIQMVWINCSCNRIRKKN